MWIEPPIMAASKGSMLLIFFRCHAYRQLGFFVGIDFSIALLGVGAAYYLTIAVDVYRRFLKKMEKYE
jgi:hypothetical protein